MEISNTAVHILKLDNILRQFTPSNDYRFFWQNNGFSVLSQKLGNHVQDSCITFFYSTLQYTHFIHRNLILLFFPIYIQWPTIYESILFNKVNNWNEQKKIVAREEKFQLKIPWNEFYFVEFHFVEFHDGSRILRVAKVPIAGAPGIMGLLFCYSTCTYIYF